MASLGHESVVADAAAGLGVAQVHQQRTLFGHLLHHIGPRRERRLGVRRAAGEAHGLRLLGGHACRRRRKCEEGVDEGEHVVGTLIDRTVG